MMRMGAGLAWTDDDLDRPERTGKRASGDDL